MTGKTLSEHFCMVHNSSDGYVDSKGIWNCWSCYKEDIYRNPPGDIIDKYTSKGYVMRLIVSGTHNVIIDIWSLPKNIAEKRVRVFYEVYNFMSQAMRKWDNLVNDIDSGTFNGNKPKVQLRIKPRLADAFPNDNYIPDEWEPNYPDDDDRDH